MISIPKIIGVSSFAFVLWDGLSPADAAHPQAETDMSDDRGSQGNQALIKRNSTPLREEEERIRVDRTQRSVRSSRGSLWQLATAYLLTLVSSAGCPSAQQS